MLGMKPFTAAAVQAAPAFMDLEAGVEKTIRLMEQAAGRNAKLIAFPECWLPGYPWFIWLGPPAWWLSFIPAYVEHAPRADGPELARIAEAARRLQLRVVLGMSERERGSLFMAQALIGPDGRIEKVRRKLKTTHVERAIFGEGDGSDFMVRQTELGRVGALCCWEHLQPLSRYAMFAEDEQIHVGSWPSFSLYTGAAYALGPEVNTIASQFYAVEGQCFVLASSALVSPEMIALMCTDDEKRSLLRAGGGATRIFAPDGRSIGSPLGAEEEGLVMAELDPKLIALSKNVADPAGHYSRPDVTRLLLNRSRNRHVMAVDQPLDQVDFAGAPKAAPTEPGSL